MKLDKRRRLSELNKAIKEEQAALADAFAELHRLHHERGELLYGALTEQGYEQYKKDSGHDAF